MRAADRRGRLTPIANRHPLRPASGREADEHAGLQSRRQPAVDPSCQPRGATLGTGDRRLARRLAADLGAVALFLAVDQGAGFAATAAAGSLAGTAAQAGFCLAYGFSTRRHSWQAALSAGTGAFAAMRLILEASGPPLWALLLVVESSLVAALLFAPRQAAAAALVPVPPRWDIPARMVVATVLVLVLTSAAPFVGARLAGLLATFPVFAAVLAVFAHRAQGNAAAQHVVRGLLLGLFAFSGFFIVIALTIERIGLHFSGH
jgi:hypothetical protein